MVRLLVHQSIPWCRATSHVASLILSGIKASQRIRCILTCRRWRPAGGGGGGQPEGTGGPAAGSGPAALQGGPSGADGSAAGEGQGHGAADSAEVGSGTDGAGGGRGAAPFGTRINPGGGEAKAVDQVLKPLDCCFNDNTAGCSCRIGSSA